MFDVWCVMRDVQDLNFVISWLYESSWDQKYPICDISDILSDIPKLIQGGSRIYTLSYKASYGTLITCNILVTVNLDYKLLAPILFRVTCLLVWFPEELQ